MYSRLIHNLSLRLTSALPSALAHDPLRAIPVGEVVPNFKHTQPPKPGSVLILLYEEDGVIKFPLIKRTEYVGAHSGQISLPGGKAEAGEDSIETALREGQEEIGIDPNTVKVIGRLSEFYVIPSNFIVTPVVASVTHSPVFKPDPHEVDRIIKAELLSFLSEDAIKMKEILAAGQYRLRAPHFEIENEIVWGATAMMLNELRIVIKEIL